MKDSRLSTASNCLNIVKFFIITMQNISAWNTAFASSVQYHTYFTYEIQSVRLPGTLKKIMKEVFLKMLIVCFTNWDIFLMFY